jgi:PTH1 family peptidyl-tRNA hydrolase
MIIVGLGNPGTSYETTRHNVGFMVLDALADTLDLGPWKLAGQVLWLKTGRHYFIKPIGFMNVSGPALQSFLTAKKIPIHVDTILVIHDDLDFPVGTVRPDRNRSSGGHQGVQSIIDVLGQDFERLRIGIGDNRPSGLPSEAYVLHRFDAGEEKIMADAIKQAVDLLRQKLA